MGSLRIKTGCSSNKDENLAVNEVLRQVEQADLKCVVFFVSSHYDQHKISNAIRSFSAQNDAFHDVEFVGCTSAGEFTQKGFEDESITAMGFASPELEVGIGVGKQISDNPIGAAKKAVEKACQQLGIGVEDLDSSKYTGLILIDGLQSVEEYIMLGASKIARNLQIAGGSAGDDFDFQKTTIHARGKVYDNAMALLIFKTDTPVRIFQTNNYLPTSKTLKITKTDFDHRIVYELNGRPAAQEYAKALGIEADALNADVFMEHPLAISYDDEYYIRSPLKVLRNEGALTFFSHVAEGTKVTVMQPGQIIPKTQDMIKKIRAEVHDIAGMIAFNCILCYRELEREGKLAKLIEELSFAPLIGFNTYGEQYNGMHVNQTMTLIVFGS